MVAYLKRAHGRTRGEAARVNGPGSTVGLPSTYTRLGLGCVGSLPAARLVPLDTPRAGATFEVRLFDLPQSSAIMLTSVRTTSLGLGSFGLPGCTLYAGIEVAMPVSGAGGQATYALPILRRSGRKAPRRADRPPSSARRRQPFGGERPLQLREQQLMAQRIGVGIERAVEDRLLELLGGEA